MPINSVKDIKDNRLFTRDGNDAWEVEAYYQNPMVKLSNLKTGEEILAEVGSIELQEFVPLVMKEK